MGTDVLPKNVTQKDAPLVLDGVLVFDNIHLVSNQKDPTAVPKTGDLLNLAFKQLRFFIRTGLVLRSKHIEM